jgi:type VI secretion system protein
MPVKLRIASVSGSVPPWELTLSKPASSIGRDATCDVYLPDPNRHLSRRHATLEFQGGMVSLLVISRVNPVVVSGREFGYQERAQLRDGDVISIADYQLTISVQADAPVAAGGLSSNEDPFAWLNNPSANGAAATPGRDPLAELSTPRAPAYEAPDPFLRGANRDSRLIQGMAPDAFASSPQAPGRATSLDPMSLVTRPEGGSPMSRPTGSALLSPSIDDFLGGLNGPAPRPSGGDELVSFTKPQARGSTGADHVHDFDLPFSPPASKSVPPSSAAVDDPFADLLGPAVPPPPPFGTPAPAPTGPTPDLADVMRPFFKGLGLDAAEVPPEQMEHYMEVAGQITRAAIAGIVQLLVARGEMKKELRADDRTMLSAAHNNPLKMMATEREAIGFLFDPRQDNAVAFMPPLEAISDACLDIMAHEFGLVAGLRAAVLGALRRYDPQVLEQQAEKQGKLASLLGNRKAQLWDGFVEWYRKTEETAADDVDSLFERDFLRAYMAQVKQIRAKK